MKERFSFDMDRAQTVLGGYLISTYRDQSHLFAQHHQFFGSAPQHANIPCGVGIGSQEHVRFLFFVTLVTLQSNSDAGFQAAVSLYEKHSDFFDERVLEIPDKVAKRTHPQGNLFLDLACDGCVDPIAVVFKEMGMNKPASWARYWRGCAKTLFAEYGGNPLKIFIEVGNVDGFLQRKKQKGRDRWFPGYGPKLFSLLALFLEELGVISQVEDAIPVDVHLQNICLSTGIVSCQSEIVDSTQLAEFLRKELVSFCGAQKTTPLELSHAMWFLGSKLCSVCSRTKNLQYACPIFDHCGGRFPTKPYWKRGRWDLRLLRDSKGAFPEHIQEKFAM